MIVEYSVFENYNVILFPVMIGDVWNGTVHRIFDNNSQQTYWTNTKGFSLMYMNSFS
jgi:hypothetical protein